IDNLEFPLSHIHESVLVYFQKYGKIKPSQNEPNRYVPFPEQLFHNIDSNIKDTGKEGFWLNLDGVFEFITYSEHRVLNIKDPKKITESLSILKEGVEAKLSEHISKKNNQEYLKNTLFAYGNLEKQIELYQRQEELLNFVIDKNLKDLTEESFQLHVEAYKIKKEILENYQSIQKEFEEFTNKETLLQGYKKRMEQLEKDHFEDEIDIDAELIKERIDGEEINLAKQKEFLTENKFDKKSFLKSQTNDISTQKKLIELKYALLGNINELKVELQKKEDQLSLADEEIEQTKLLSEQLFKGTILFEENI